MALFLLISGEFVNIRAGVLEFSEFLQSRSRNRIQKNNLWVNLYLGGEQLCHPQNASHFWASSVFF